MDNDFVVITEDGKEIAMEVLFTFEADKNDVKFAGRKYVVYYDPKNEDNGLFASIYDDNNNLSPVEEDDEWNMINEVVEAFYADDEEEEENSLN